MLPPIAVSPLAGLLRLKVHRHPVDAVAEMGRRGAVFKYMAEMTAAAAAVDLGTDHAVTLVARALDRAGLGIVEARPAGAALELGLGDEQLLPAAGAVERAGALFVIQCTAARSL